MKCPRCGLEMELCEATTCKHAPHWICSEFLGCNLSFKADKEEVKAYRWPAGADEARDVDVAGS